MFFSFNCSLLRNRNANAMLMAAVTLLTWDKCSTVNLLFNSGYIQENIYAEINSGTKITIF